MNREIKFRAFDDSEMLTMPINTNYGLSRFFGCLRDDAVIMQFTGLKDKNGNEIYEGDVLQTKNNIVEVFFGKKVHSVFMFGKRDTIEINGWLVKNSKNHTDVLDESFIHGKIIGNIYENPELLNR